MRKKKKKLQLEVGTRLIRSDSISNDIIDIKGKVKTNKGYYYKLCQGYWYPEEYIYDNYAIVTP